MITRAFTALILAMCLSACGPTSSETSSPPTTAINTAEEQPLAALPSELDFGALALGTPVAALPPGARLQRTCIDTDLPCAFELDGVSYGTQWDDNIVTVKTIRVGGERPRWLPDERAPWLPFGLAGDETMNEALAHLNARFNGVFAIGSNDSGDIFVIAQGSNDRLEYFEVSLRFERNGHLSEVRASCCYD